MHVTLCGQKVDGQAQVGGAFSDLALVDRIHHDHHVRLIVPEKLGSDDPLSRACDMHPVFAWIDVDHVLDAVTDVERVEEAHALRSCSPDYCPAACAPNPMDLPPPGLDLAPGSLSEYLHAAGQPL